MTRTKVKRRKASASWAGWRPAAKAQYSSEVQAWWRREVAKSVGSYPWRSAGFRASGRREDERTSEPMTLQIKDRRAVSRKPSKDGLNPMGRRGGEGKRRRRRWRQQSRNLMAVGPPAPAGGRAGRGPGPIPAHRELRRCRCVSAPRPEPTAYMPRSRTSPCARGGAWCNVVRIDGTDGSQTGRQRWESARKKSAVPKSRM